MAGNRSTRVRAIDSRRSAVPGDSRSAAPTRSRVVDKLRAGPVQGSPVQAGEGLLLGGVQHRDVPFEADEQIDPPRVGQRPGINQQQRRRVFGAGP